MLPPAVPRTFQRRETDPLCDTDDFRHRTPGALLLLRDIHGMNLFGRGERRIRRMTDVRRAGTDEVLVSPDDIGWKSGV